MIAFKRILLALLGICCIGGSALFAEFYKPAKASNITDPATWIASPLATLAAALGIAFVLLSVFANVVQVSQAFAQKPATKKDFDNFAKDLETKVLAALNSRDPDLKRAESAAVANILASADPLDQPAKSDLKRLDFDASVDELFKAAEADEAQAARRYRDAGALSYGRNVAKALKAYERASRLDPADVWTWIFLARLRVSSGDTAAALTAARSALAHAKAARDRSVSLSEIGDVLRQQGDVGGALKSFSDSLDIARKLAEADQSDARAQRDLSISFDNVGNVLLQKGDLAGALKSFSDSLDIRRKLADADKNDAQAQVDLGISCDKIADALEESGDLAGACSHYRESLERFSNVAKVAPDWADVSRWAKEAEAHVRRTCAAA
ncbi:MAG TPA: tetratricopeptide repeat protein [Rhizomicrobium sp.]|nr:tetratricopeptide repeat protein [Rhizomicrobium sp.]